MKLTVKYLGYFALVSGIAGTIYGLGVFFTNIQSDLKHVVNTLTEIKTTVTDQNEEIKGIKYEMMEITDVQDRQKVVIYAIDKSWSDHLKKSKSLIDEYTRYLEMQVQDEKKKKYSDSVSSNIEHRIKIEKIK